MADRRPGIGWSSPIVWEGRVFVTSATPDGTSCHVLCLAAASGKILWDKEVFRQAMNRTLDRADWKRGVSSQLVLQEMIEALHDFKEVVQFKVVGGWEHRS